MAFNDAGSGYETVTPPQKEGAPPRFLPFRSLIDEFVDDAARRKALYDAKQNFGPISGFGKLDDILGGCLESGVHIVHGSPGAAKTAFVLQVGAQCECPCLLVTTEMPSLELFRRHSSRVNQQFLGSYKRGKANPNMVRSDAIRAAAAAPSLSLLDATENVALPQHIAQYASEAREFAKENGDESPHLLIIVDSVHTWADGVFEGTSVAEYDRLNAGIGLLRRMSRAMKCTIIGVAERNRLAIKAKEEGAGQNSSAGSRKFEYVAESMIGLDSEGEESDTGRGTKEHPVTERTIKAKISKNRHGIAGKEVYFKFCGAFQEFTEEAF